MIKIIRDLFSVLTPSQKKRFYILQILVMLMAVTQIAGVASIVPFMALVADMNQLNQDTIFAQAFIISGIASEGLFVFLLGVGVLVMLFLGTIISMYTTWRLSLFANKVGVEIADSLYSYYLKKDWLFHASGSETDCNCAQLTKQDCN